VTGKKCLEKGKRGTGKLTASSPPRKEGVGSEGGDRGIRGKKLEALV